MDTTTCLEALFKLLVWPHKVDPWFHLWYLWLLPYLFTMAPLQVVTLSQFKKS